MSNALRGFSAQCVVGVAVPSEPGSGATDLFGTIAALGGPVDVRQLLRDMVNDNFEVKSQRSSRSIGDDFTFDHQAPYPRRDTPLSVIKGSRHRMRQSPAPS